VEFQHEGRVFGWDVSPDGSRILTEGVGCQVWRSDLTAPVELPRTAAVCRFSPDGQRVVYWNGRGISVVAVDGTGLAVETTGTWSPGQGGAFSPDGSRVLTLSDAARLWWADGTGEPVVLGGSVGKAHFSHDGTRILTLSSDGTARIWPVGDPPGLRVFRGHREKVNSVAVSPDGKRVVSASFDGTVRVWPVGGGEPVVLRKLGSPRFRFAALSPDGSRVATTGPGGTLVWPSAGGEPLALSTFDSHIPWGVAFSPDGAWLAGGEMTRAEVVVARSDGSGGAVTLNGGGRWVAFSPDGSRLVAGGNGTRVWRTGDWATEPAVLQGSGDGQVAFDPRGSMILTGSSDGVQVFALDGHELVGLRRPGGEAVAWSPDGERIATGLEDGSARISRLDLGGETIVLRGCLGPVTGVAFTPDGHHLATSSMDMNVRLWLIDWAELVHALRAATTACLTVDQRVTHLDESPAKARAAWAACERGHGREP
jgi:WD40 repeat protein